MKRTLLVCLFVLGSLVSDSDPWLFQFNKKPRFFGNKLSKRNLQPSRRHVQKKIVQYHNYFRATVEPPASNMLRLRWNRQAAQTAQSWADQCHFMVHSSNEDRRSSRYGVCGQNILVSSAQVPWMFVVRTWNSEKSFFTYGGNNILKVVGHYTQVVWAASSQVGCGLTKCYKDYARNVTRTFYNYVCDYCPGGNIDINRPYKRGKRCSSCPRNCKANKLCTNFCPVVDMFSNCGELKKTFKPLCHHPQYKNSCKATCLCRNKIQTFN